MNILLYQSREQNLEALPEKLRTSAEAELVRASAPASGAKRFVDLHVRMDGNPTLNEAHAMTEKVEQKVHTLLPQSDVTVHVEPLEMKRK